MMLSNTGRACPGVQVGREHDGPGAGDLQVARLPRLRDGTQHNIRVKQYPNLY